MSRIVIIFVISVRLLYKSYMLTYNKSKVLFLNKFKFFYIRNFLTFIVVSCREIFKKTVAIERK